MKNKEIFRFPRLKEPKLSHNTFWIDEYFLLDEMSRIKNDIKRKINQINDDDLLLNVYDNRLDDFINKIFNKYGHICPYYTNVTFTNNDFLECIEDIRKYFKERIKFLCEREKKFCDTL